MDARMNLLGYDFANRNLDQLVEDIRTAMTGEAMQVVVPLNAACLVYASRDPRIDAIVQQADVFVLDSRVVAGLAKVLGLAVPHVVPGSTLTDYLLSRVLTPQDTVCLVVAGAEVEAAVRAQFPHINGVYIAPKYGIAKDPDEIARVGAEIASTKADFTFFCIGFPQQEMLALAARAAGARGIGLCAGASLHFATGLTERAPLWMQRLGLEWLHRLLSEPRRLARRYLVDSPVIIRMLLAERSRQRTVR
jgi:N-acetylglucosaminyldiphosphoundecaprenol N-acetyl-beta-D-mannosaminyltransferase